MSSLDVILAHPDGIVGIDPAPSNCGIVWLHPKTGHVLVGANVAFVEDPTASDLGNRYLITSVSKWILENQILFRGRNVYIEDQGAAANRKNSAVQTVFQCLISRSKPVHPKKVAKQFALSGLGRSLKKKRAVCIMKRYSDSSSIFIRSPGRKSKMDDIADAFLVGFMMHLQAPKETDTCESSQDS